MAYNKTKYNKLRSLEVPHRLALSLADDTAPKPGAAGVAIANLNTGTATTAQIATAVNAILAELRTQGIIAP